MKVIVNGYGMLPFRATECHKFDGREDLVQFRGEVKLPKGVKTGGGSKWMAHDYWYTTGQITPTYNTAPSEADNFKKANDFVTAEILAYLFGPQCGGESCTNPNCSCKKAETFAKQNDVNENRVEGLYKPTGLGENLTTTNNSGSANNSADHKEPRQKLTDDMLNSNVIAKGIMWGSFEGSGYREGLAVNSFDSFTSDSINHTVTDGGATGTFGGQYSNSGSVNNSAENPEPTFEELEIERVKQAMQTLNLEHPDEVGFYKSLLNVYQKLNEIYLY